MPVVQQQKQQQEFTKLKIKIQTLLTKLSDRDTITTATTELNRISTTLDSKTLPIFISCILSVSSTDKPLSKKHSLCLISTLSLHHTNSLCPYVPKILSFLLRRVRDGGTDASSVRSECVSTVRSLASNVTKLELFGGFLKPLTEALTTERDGGGQLGIGLFLVAAVDVAGLPLQRVEGNGWRWVLGKLERVLRSEGFKAKSVGLMVIGSVIGVGGLKGYNGVGGLVKILVGFLSSGDWQVRKASAQALVKLAVVEGGGGGGGVVAVFKSECLVVFDKKRFDKVKAVRDVMNQFIEA